MLIHNGSVLGSKEINKFSLVNSKYESYFDGSDLSRWLIPKNNIWWAVQDKVLKVKSGPHQKGSILWTKDKFENFRVRFKFKFGKGTVDSGIFMRGDDASNPQIQIGISGSLKRDMTGSPYVPQQGYPKEAKLVKQLLNQNDWNKMEAEAIGNRYRVWLNDKQVMDYTLEEANLIGPVGIQLHSKRDMEIWYKSIDIASF